MLAGGRTALSTQPICRIGVRVEIDSCWPLMQTMSNSQTFKNTRVWSSFSTTSKVACKLIASYELTLLEARQGLMVPTLNFGELPRALV